MANSRFPLERLCSLNRQCKLHQHSPGLWLRPGFLQEMPIQGSGKGQVTPSKLGTISSSNFYRSAWERERVLQNHCLSVPGILKITPRVCFRITTIQKLKEGAPRERTEVCRFKLLILKFSTKPMTVFENSIYANHHSGSKLRDLQMLPLLSKSALGAHNSAKEWNLIQL